MEKRTLREWFVYLDAVERELTLTEFMAVMLFNSREYTRIMLEMVRELQNASEHSEAVLGALDQLAERVAASSGLPYAASHDERAAMASRWRSGGRQTAEPALTSAEPMFAGPRPDRRESNGPTDGRLATESTR